MEEGVRFIRGISEEDWHKESTGVAEYQEAE
jgi:hypothetical protein